MALHTNMTRRANRPNTQPPLSGPMARYRMLICTGLAVAACAILAGCKTPAVPEGTRLTDEELSTLYQNAIDPRTASITTYESAAGPVFNGANRVHRGRQQKLEFIEKEGSTLPVIHMSGRGGPLVALIDTSSFKSWANLDAASLLGLGMLNPGDQTLATQVVDAVPGYAGLADTVWFDKLRMESALFYLRAAKGSLGPLSRNLTDPAPQVVLGSDMISAWAFVQINWSARTVVMSSTTPYRVDPNSMIVHLPLSYADGAMTVKGAINGVPTDIVIDTGGDYNLALPDPESETVRQISIGDLVLRHVSCVPSDTMDFGHSDIPRVGVQMLSQFKVTFDNQGRGLYIERPDPVKKGGLLEKVRSYPGGTDSRGLRNIP